MQIDLNSHSKLTVITEGGRDLGFGHVTRCLSISSVFKQNGFDINFIVNADESISKVLNETYSLYNWIDQKDKLFEEINGSTVLLIDSSLISNDIILELEDTLIPIIFIDDELRRNVLNRGYVLDWTILSEKKNHFSPKKEKVTYLLGSQYTPLRKEFKDIKQIIIKNNIEAIMITFGGADVRNLTPSILKELSSNFPNIKKNIIVGNGFENIEQIKKYKDAQTNLIYNVDASKMIEVMQSSDLAIASGGQTLYELVRLGLPTIAILLVENAKDDTFGWAKVGSVVNIGWWDDQNLLDNLTISIKKLKSHEQRLNLQRNGFKYISPNGASTLVNKILEGLK